MSDHAPHPHAHRRELADLPRLLRPADRHGDRVRAGHQRGVRVHVDAHQPAARPPATTGWRWPSTGPSRRSATSGSTTYKANRSAAPDILRQQMGLVRQVIDTLEIPTLEQAGFEADDIIATLATRARDEGRHVHHRHRRPRQLPAGRGPRHQGPLQPARRVATTRSTTRPASRSAPASTRRCYVQYAALRGDPSDNLPGVPGRGREDGGQAHQQVRRPRRHLRAPRRADPEARARTSREHEAQVARERRGDGAPCATSSSASRSTTS